MEKRTFRRVGCNFQSLMKKVDEDKADASKTAINDISEGGVRLSSKHAVSFSDQFYITLKVSFWKMVEAAVQPVWVHWVPERRQYEIGARFLYLNNDDRDYIRGYVSGRL